MTEVFYSQPSSPPDDEGVRFTGLSWFCACSSFTLLGLYLLLGVHIRLGLGHWPTPMFEDCKAPLFQAHAEIVCCFLLFTWWFVGPLWLICLLVRPLRPRLPDTILYQLATFVGGYLLIVAVLTFDPTTFSAWYLD